MRQRLRLRRWRWRCRLLSGVACAPLLVCGFGCPADAAPAAPAPKAKRERSGTGSGPASSSGAISRPAPEEAIGAPQSVETIASSASPSVVVVSHAGRQGARDEGVGTGFIVSTNGLIATCLHVIGEGRAATVQLADGRRFEVREVHAWDRRLDLALVRIDAPDLKPLRLGDSDTLAQGAPVVALGNPLGMAHSVVEGVMSAKRDFDGIEMIQVAIPIESGNSGGPLLDRLGRVRGILTMKSMLSPNLGFATPVNLLKRLLAQPNPVPMARWLRLGSINAAEWQPVFGARWTQKGGRIEVDGAGDGFGGRALCLAHAEPPTLPFELGVHVRLADESGAAGLVFGSDGAQRHYGFYPSAGQLRLTRFDGPDVFSWTILRQVATDHYKPGNWNHLKVRVEAERVLCYVNGELVAEARDPAFAGARVGLAKFRDTRAGFRAFECAGQILAPGPSAAVSARLRDDLLGTSPQALASRFPELLRDPEASRGMLENHALRLEREASSWRRLADEVHKRAVRTELMRLFELPEERVDLFHAALLVAKLDDPLLDVAFYLKQMASMAREIETRLPADAGDGGRVEAIREYLFRENGFHGSRTDYYNRANSYVSQVLDDREGLPITLSVVFLDLARRVGVRSVSGVGVPAHFMVKFVPSSASEQLIDVFNGGAILTRTEAAQMVADMTDGPLLEEHLQPASKRAIIVRMLRNLAGVAERAEPVVDPGRYLDLILALDSDAVPDRLRRVRLRMAANDAVGAREDLQWFIDHEPPGMDLETVTQWLRALPPPLATDVR